MKVKVINSSSRKTRASIKAAFAQLTKEKKNMQNITIKELVQRAGITRSSFYTHYDNIYDVAKDIQDEFLDVLFNEDFQINSLNTMEEYLDIIFEHLKDNEELYKMILTSDEPLIFMNRLNRMMNSHLIHFFQSKNIRNLTLNVAFFVDGTLNIFIQYFRSEIEVSLEDLKLYIMDIFKTMFLK